MKAKKSYRYKNFEDLRGKWVICKGEKVIAYDVNLLNLKEVWESNSSYAAAFIPPKNSIWSE